MTVIVADIGASNARFALLTKGKLSDIYQFSCDDFKNPEGMIASFKNAYAPKASALIIGVAGAVIDDKVCWTNRPWQLKVDRLKKKLALKKIILKNDVEVQCMALPCLKPKDFCVLQKGNVSAAPKALLSLGTGVGAAYYWDKMAFATEYGQTLLDSGVPLEKILHHLPANLGSVFGTKRKSKQQISCQEFYQKLAYIVRNFVLTLKPCGGLYLYGGMLDFDMLKKERFVPQVIVHPTMCSFLKSVPIYLIKQEHLAFIGLKELARKYGLS